MIILSQPKRFWGFIASFFPGGARLMRHSTSGSVDDYGLRLMAYGIESNELRRRNAHTRFNSTGGKVFRRVMSGV